MTFEFEPKNKESPLISKAISLIDPENSQVIDLGPGNGRNIKTLLKSNAVIYVYDNDQKSIKIIKKKFINYIKYKKLFVYNTTFEDIKKLPKNNMIIAWRSLSFMPKNDFDKFWKIIVNSLKINGIFTGTFFGEHHKTLRPLDRPALFRLTKKETLSLFTSFEIISFYEEFDYDKEVSLEWGGEQYEHLYKIIAKKTRKINTFIDNIL